MATFHRRSFRDQPCSASSRLNTFTGMILLLMLWRVETQGSNEWCHSSNRMLEGTCRRCDCRMCRSNFAQAPARASCQIVLGAVAAPFNTTASCSTLCLALLALPHCAASSTCTGPRLAHQEKVASTTIHVAVDFPLQIISITKVYRCPAKH